VVSMNPDLVTPVERDGTVNAVIETPKGSRHKYKYRPDFQAIALDKAMPVGFVFPFDFGFIPRTRAEDGDPLDLLLLLDGAVFPGCVVPCRLVGAIEAEQTIEGRTLRNDRLIATALRSIDYSGLNELPELNPFLLQQLEQFFITYLQAQGRRFRPLRRVGSEAAHDLLRDAFQTAQA
jgi:inorganic pyrophosphatase